jgi:membrane protein
LLFTFPLAFGQAHDLLILERPDPETAPMSPKAAFQLLKDSFTEWNADNAPRLGAALAYYTVFSIAPLLVIAIGVAGLVFGEDTARRRLLDQLRDLIDPSSLQAIEEMLKHADTAGRGVVHTVVGGVILLFGALGVFVELTSALNTVWKVQPQPGLGLLRLVKERALSFAMVLVIGLLLLASLVISAVLSALGQWLTSFQLPGGNTLWQDVNVAVSFCLITLLFAVIYKVLPDVHIAWRDVWTGAVVTALLFTAGKQLLGLYLGHANVVSAYGAAGSLVVLLVWVYYSAQVFLFGAEFTRVYARWRGTRLTPRDHATTVAADAHAR